MKNIVKNTSAVLRILLFLATLTTLSSTCGLWIGFEPENPILKKLEK